MLSSHKEKVLRINPGIPLNELLDTFASDWYAVKDKQNTAFLVSRID